MATYLIIQQRPFRVESGLSIGPASPPKFFSIRGTSAEIFHFLCHFTMPGVTEIVKKAFAINTRFFTYCVTRHARPNAVSGEGSTSIAGMFLLNQFRHVIKANGGDLSPDECRDAAEGRHPLYRGSM
jgi:hypothetical protein